MSIKAVKESRRNRLADAAEELVASASESSFDAATFFEKFELLAGTPGWLVSLRGAILDIACAGLTSSRSGDDDDVQDLLNSITEARSSRRLKIALEPEASLNIPSHWRTVTLDKVTDIVRGVSFPGGEKATVRGSGQVACLRTASVQAEIDWDDLIFIDSTRVKRNDQWVQEGDIVISMANSYELVGKVAIVRTVPEKSTFGAFLAVIRPIGIDAFYLMYALRSPRMQSAFRDSSSQTTNIANISLGRMRPMLFPLPPLAEQKRIVGKVDELMGLCDRLEALEAERKERHASLSRAALARFADSPTTTNLQFLFHKSFDVEPNELRRIIRTLAVKGSLEGSQVINDDVHVDFEGIHLVCNGAEANPKLPHGWGTCTYRSLTTLVTSGSRGWKEFYADSGAVFIRTQNIKTDQLLLDDVAFVDLPKSTEGKRTQVMTNDILITITGANVTKAARVEEVLSEAYVSQHVALTRPRWPEMSPWLHLCFVSHGSARGILESLAYGDKPGLNLNNIRDLVLPIPPLAEQKRIVAKVDELMALVGQLEQQLAHSRTLGQQLLDAVVTRLIAAPDTSNDAD